MGVCVGVSVGKIVPVGVLDGVEVIVAVTKGVDVSQASDNF